MLKICCVIFFVAHFATTGIGETLAENSEGKLEHFSCSSQSGEIKNDFHCVVEFLYATDHVVPTCIIRGHNLVISVGVSVYEKSIFNASLVCISRFHLDLNVVFQNGEPKMDYIEMRPERTFENFSDPSTFKYKLNILFPNEPALNPFSGETVKYEIFNAHDTTNPITVFLEFFQMLYEDDEMALSVCRIYNLHGRSSIRTRLNEEMVTLPCIYFLSKNSVRLFQYFEDYDKGRVYLPVDNSSLYYDQMKGFLLNTTLFDEDFEENVYKCSTDSNFHVCENNDFDFSVKPPADSGYSPANNLCVYGTKFNILTGRTENSPIKLSCYTKGPPAVNIQLQSLNGVEPTINVTYDNFSLGKPPTYFATVIVPYLTEEERKNVTGWSNVDRNELMFECKNFEGTNPVWTIYYDAPEPPLYYSEKHNAFICRGAMKRDDSFTHIRHWECNNIFQCQVVSSYCLPQKEPEGNDCVDYCQFKCNIRIPKKENENNCMKFLQTNPVTCNSVDLRAQDFYPGQCEAIRPAKRGIVQCVKVDTLVSTTDMHYIYFQGFDGKIYVQIDEKPPLTATLKMTVINKEKSFYKPGHFSFRCEAHSFFYADGIQWFFKFENGSTMPPPKYATEYIDVPHLQDKYNPESNVKFYFDDTTLVQVICSAPLLSNDKWDEIFMDVKVYEARAPEITTTETIVYLKEKAKEQNMACQATGIPQPEIIWTRFNEPSKVDEVIKEPLRVLDMIIFPDYNETFFGEYTCTAKSVAGNNATVFTVSAPPPNPVGKNNNILYYTLATLGFLGLIIATSSVTYYFRQEKMKRRREMKEIIGLVEGIEMAEGDVTDEGNSDPLQLPFKKCYEMERENFIIRWNSPLGKGEFGEVYQGTLQGVEGPIAVKTLKKDAKVEHLKALASELKILIYIGQHENLVALLGAYKQELEKGILYLAVEFCGLGSLVSYLRSNKHLFLRCPQLRFHTGNIERDTFEMNSSLHSLETLLKWCKQITCGMEYLGSKHIVHSDLAARNVLLTSEGNAKVTDFGLSRRMYNYTEYIKTADDPLPWQWLSPESITLQVFSCKSDVWAYGITVWEIFSFGEIPYPTLTFNQQFLEILQRGQRNNKPKYASNALYKLMAECWKYDPEERPSFSTLKSSIQELIENRLNNVMEVEIHFKNEPSDLQMTLPEYENVPLEISLKEQPCIEEGYTVLGEFR